MVYDVKQANRLLIQVTSELSMEDAYGEVDEDENVKNRH